MSQDRVSIPTQSAQGHWSSRLIFILATSGAAIGLGNIWKFPYMVGEHGGAAFIAVYLICVLMLGIPAMLAEALIGHHGRQNSVDSLSSLALEAKHTRWWQLAGWWGALALLIILSFYSVVSGWILAYLVRVASGQFQGLTPTEVGDVFGHLLARPGEMLLWHTLFLLMTFAVVLKGVKGGLERATRIFMPALLAILCVLAMYAIVRGDSSQALRFLFHFNLDKLTPQIIISAMGHAFFTLAVGAGAIITYSAYMPAHTPIIRSVTLIAVLDTLVALIAGLAIFPLVFAFELAPTEGPGLIFNVLPIIFAEMIGGQVIGTLFFLFFLLATWTSSINLVEPLVVILIEKCKLKRTTACMLVASLIWLLGIGSLLSFNLWQNVHFFGKQTWFDFATRVPETLFLPLGGLLFALFVGWIMDKQVVKTSLGLNDKPKLYRMWTLLFRYITPLSILIVFINTLFFA